MVVGLHEDVGAANVYLVFADAAFDAHELAVDRDLVGDLESGEEALEDGLAGLGDFVETAKGIAGPIVAVLGGGAAIVPLGIVADAADADEEIDVAHHLGEDELGDVDHVHGLAGLVDEAYLVGGYIVPDAGVAHLVLDVELFDPEFAADLVGGELDRGLGAVHAVIEGAEQGVLPATDAGEGVELVLLDEVRGHAVAVDAGIELGFGDEVDLAVGLLAGLLDLQLLEAESPLQDFGLGNENRVPETDAGGGGDAEQLVAGDVFPAVVAVEGGQAGAVDFEDPDELAGDDADEAVVEVIFLEGLVAPLAVFDIAAVDAVPLGGGVFLNLRDGILELLQPVAELLALLDEGGRGLLWGAVGLDPL